MDVRLGFPDNLIPQAAVLYDEAFAAKLRPAIRDDASRQRVLAAAIDPGHAIAALSDGELVGLAGFHHEGGSLTGGMTFRSLLADLGLFRALNAAFWLALLERKPGPGELLMDGIVVRSDWRGQGVGTQLFEELERFARVSDLTSIRLDVIDTNEGARRLYERLGFVPTKTERTPYLKPIMGFSASTEMVKHLN